MIEESKENVNIEDIDIEMESDENENAEQIKMFIQGNFIEVLLGKVFTYIDEKKQHESKRKTWNLKHQEEEVVKVKQKRKEWRPEANSVKSKLDALFEGTENNDVGGGEQIL